LRVQKEAKRIASKRVHESEEQRQQRRMVEATRIAAKLKLESEKDFKKLQQKVGCGGSSEHQERLVRYHGAVHALERKYLFYYKKDGGGKRP